MIPTFLIIVREAFEAALLLGIIYAYLWQVGAGAQARYVTWGAVLGVVASVGAGIAVSVLSGPLLDVGPDVVGIVVLFVSVVVLTWMLLWMRQHARGLRSEVHRQMDAALLTQRWWLIGVLAFTGVFREGAETVLYVWALLTQAGAGTGGASLMGGLLGLATAALLAWGIFHGGTAISLRHFFTVTSGLLLCVAAGLFSTGIGRLQGLGVLPASAPLWDTSFLLRDDSLAGAFLTSLVGYRARPTGLEVAACVGYLLIAGLWLFGHRLSPRGPQVTSVLKRPNTPVPQ
jgi:high-affinity iron transporter